MQLLYLPTTIFMTAVDMLGKVMGAPQRSMAGLGEPPASSSTIAPRGASLPTAPANGAGASSATRNSIAKESNGMGGDQDLSGEDIVKTVVYSIVFTKRDLEAPLKKETDVLVNYDTDGASFGALKMVEFGNEKFERPKPWVENKYPTENADADLAMKDIPEEDKKYVRFTYRVRDRFPKGDADYERRQTRALEGIERKL